MVSLRALLTGFALIAAPVTAAVGSVEVGKVLKDLDSEVTSLKPVVKSINADNAALLPQGGGPLPVLLSGFSRIIKDFKLITTIVVAGGPVNSRVGRMSRAHNATDGPDSMHASKACTQFLQHTGDLLKTLRDRAPTLQGVPAAIPPMIDAISELRDEYEGIAGSIERIEDDDSLFSGTTTNPFDGPQDEDESSDEDDSSDEDESSDDEGDSSEDEDEGSDDEDEESDDEDEGPKQAFRNTRDILDAVLVAYRSLLGHSCEQGAGVI